MTDVLPKITVWLFRAFLFILAGEIGAGALDVAMKMRLDRQYREYLREHSHMHPIFPDPPAAAPVEIPSHPDAGQ